MKSVPLSRRRALVSGPADELIPVYTIQSVSAWDAARERGYLTGSPELSDGDFLVSYGWMRAQMALRLPRFSGDFPVWAWTKRPNMRQWPYTADHVLITARVPRGRILPSDFDSWHCILNHWFISLNEEEDDALVRDNVPPETTWHRVFDILESEPGFDPKWRGRTLCPQLCVDRITTGEVVSAVPATGRVGRNRKKRV